MSQQQSASVAGFHHVAIRARDFDKTLAMYGQGLGFAVKIAWGSAPKRAVLLDLGRGGYLEIFERAEQAHASDEGQILHFALRTDNCTSALERARAAGFVVTMEPKDVRIDSTPHPTPVRIAFCKGPDGEVLEFFENQLT